jgi:anaerobic selenocysteine-containing dehydrogenase/Fe-S cluster biogenesis protein NfuA
MPSDTNDEVVTPTASDASALYSLDPLEFMNKVNTNPSMLSAPKARRRREKLLAQSSVCSYCGVGCPYTVETDQRGNRRIHPLSPLGLCVKGKTSLITGGDAERAERLAKRGLADDRIRVPMIRGHDGNMHEVSWDEALDRAAWLFLHAREWVGPQAVAVYGNGQKTMEAIWMASLYKLVFKLPTMGANSEHCLTSAGSAHILNFGNEASFTSQQFEELSQCDVAVLHGTNAFVTFPQAYEKLKQNTAAVKVVIDPTLSDTVSDLQQSDSRTLHIRFRQGGDVLFNLAVSRIILEQQWEDRDSLARQVDPASLIDLRNLCFSTRCEPYEAAKRIALPDQDPSDLAETMQRFAELIAKPINDYRPKLAYVSSMGVNQSTGSYGFSTNLNLLLLTGNVGRTGAGSLRIAGQSNATSELMMGFNARKLLFNLDPGNDEHRNALASALDIPVKNIPSSTGTSVAQMADDDHLYCVLFIGTQMTKNMPRLGHWTRRMGRSFNIVIDSFLGEGVLEHADVLLPSYTYTERTGVIQRGDRTLQLQQQITEPPAQAWSDSQILARLALKIAERLRDPDTAALNDLDADTVHRTFSRYLDSNGDAMPARIFDHIVAVNRHLKLYSKLEDDTGAPISHDMLRQRAGLGVQWGGNKRYHHDATDGPGFTGLHQSQQQLATLVRPPDKFMDRLEAPLPVGTLSLISGRGRPGHRALKGRSRYNSGIKTLPIYGRDSDVHYVEVHPEVARERGLSEHEPVRLLSEHGVVVAEIAFNERIAHGTAFIDFVPGEVNRLTDYVEADQFTHQSLIKRTPVELRGLRALETRLWREPSINVLNRCVDIVYTDWRTHYPNDEDWLASQRDIHARSTWLPSSILRNPSDDHEQRLSEAVGALSIFFQQYATQTHYREQLAPRLHALTGAAREQLLYVLLPLARRLDYQSVLHPILAAIVGAVTVVDETGATAELNLLSAHKSAVLEFKEEIVAIQLFVAIKRGLDKLYGPGVKVSRDNLAFVSGVAIPCAGDVPAHFLGISPAELNSALLVHSRAIGSGALIIVDRKHNRAVRVDVVTGVLPKDKELGQLRGQVINRKRVASALQHRRFFDRLGELIVQYVRTGDSNFTFSGPVPFNWQEYRSKLSFAPANRREFHRFLIDRQVSFALANSLAELGVLDAHRDAQVLKSIRTNSSTADNVPVDVFDQDQLYAGSLSERIDRVYETIIKPVLENDGGRLDILSLDEDAGELHVRFVGSCANCPYSLLSMEQIVKPTLLAIPGLRRVVHRAKARNHELQSMHITEDGDGNDRALGQPPVSISRGSSINNCIPIVPI